MAFLRYLKAAFLGRWNLLAFGGAAGFALLSGRVDVFLPLVCAGELLYVGLLASNEKFRKYVDAAAYRGKGAAQSVDDTVDTILHSLSPQALTRFKALRARCLELRQISSAMRDPTLVRESVALENLQIGGLDRLLWHFLRMLHTQHSLARFLTTANVEAISKEIARVEARMKKQDAKSTDPHQQKLSKTLGDNLDTLRERLQNLDKARANYEFLELEIDRLENKIRSVSELAINRQDSEFVSSQVDQVVASIAGTERTLSELDLVGGLPVADDTVPKLLERDRQVVVDQ